MKPMAALISNYGIGGSLLYLQQLARAFQALGYPMLYYIPERTDMGISDTSQCRYVLSEPSLCPRILKKTSLKYGYHLLKYLYNAVTVTPEGSVGAAHILFPFYLTDWITVRRLKKRGIGVVVTVHEVFPHRPFLGGALDKLFVKAFCARADILSVHTASLKAALVNAYGIEARKICVIPHGYFAYPGDSMERSTLKERYSLPRDRKILLFFGGIRRNKGLDILLRAMTGLREEFFLVIAGRTIEDQHNRPEYYRNIIEAEGIGDSVLWIERHIPNDVVPDLFRAADAVVLPYKGSFHAQSGVLNLAVGYEKPCVVTDVGGMGETVREFALGVVVQPESVDLLREGIRSLFSGGSGSYGFEKHKQEHSWEAIARKYIEIYEKLLPSARD